MGTIAVAGAKVTSVFVADNARSGAACADVRIQRRITDASNFNYISIVPKGMK